MTSDTPKFGKLRWLRYAAVGIGAVVFLYGAASIVFNIWIRASLPPDAPRIAFSLDDTWLNRLGVTRATYEQAFTRAGAELVPIQPDDVGEGAFDDQVLEDRLASLDIHGVLLSGGGDVDPRLYGGEDENTLLVNRRRDEFEIALIRAATRKGLPILGICRGCQILNVAYGGTLKNLRNDETLRKQHFNLGGHPVMLSSHSRLAEMLGHQTIDRVLSFHGQAVDEPGENVTITAKSPDGAAEAVEIDGRKGSSWIVGIQWHPELAVGDGDQEKLLKAFVAQAAAVRDGTRAPHGVSRATVRPGEDKEQAHPRPGHTRTWAVKIDKPGLPNFHRVSENLYRGAQPTAEGMKELEKLGIKTVVNLRLVHSDRDEIGDLNLDYEHINMETWRPEEDEILRFLSVVTDESRWPVFVHCKHGADRTGLMCAIYRITVCGWSKDEAIREMTGGGFGFHKVWSNLITYVEELDVDSLRMKAGLKQRIDNSCN